MLQLLFNSVTNLVEICDKLFFLCGSLCIYTSYTELHGGGTELHRGLPIRIQVFYQLICFQYIRFEHSFLLEGCYVFAYAIIEYRVIAFGYEFVYAGGEVLYLTQLQANGFALGLCGSGFYALKLNEAVV